MSIHSYFPSQGPLEIDIGCGKGRFLLARSKAHPHVNFLGLERMLVRVRKIDKKILKDNMTNVRLLRSEASYALRYLIPAECASTLYMFFPDPWPKRRHHDKRTFNHAFVDLLYKTLLPGGIIYLATDHLDYYEEMKKIMTPDLRFEEVPPFAPLDSERTDFELLFMADNLPIGRCAYRKKTQPATDLTAGTAPAAATVNTQ